MRGAIVDITTYWQLMRVPSHNDLQANNTPSVNRCTVYALTSYQFTNWYRVAEHPVNLWSEEIGIYVNWICWCVMKLCNRKVLQGIARFSGVLPSKSINPTLSSSGTRSKRDDLLLRLPAIVCLMKYFWAWLATCVGLFDWTKCLEMPLQFPCTWI